MNMSKKNIMLANFLGGLSWGLGTVIGATVVVAIIGAILSALGVFEGIGNFFDQLNAFKEIVQPSQFR